MYYSNGNYEAFARPKKPENVDDKSAYIVGSGLAALSTAVFLVRDAQMPGDHIHILEELSLPGGSMDGIKNDRLGYIIRGGREMEPHFEVLWDLFRSIPSLENPDHSILDEFYWLNKEDPCYAKTRIICNRGKALPNDGQLTLSEKAIKEMINLILMPESKLENVQIDQVFDDEFSILISGSTGVQCLPLNLGQVPWKCAAISCALFSTLAASKIFLLFASPNTTNTNL